MLAYAAHRRPRRQLSPTAPALTAGGPALPHLLARPPPAPPRRPRRHLSPTALALIVGGHALAIVLVASTKMDLPGFTKAPPTTIIPITIPPEPEPAPTPPQQQS